MKLHKNYKDNDLIRRIAQRESDEQYAEEALICSRCFSRILYGRYYKIDNEAICGKCIDACERKK